MIEFKSPIRRGSLVTNFDISRLANYETAIAEFKLRFKDDRLYILDKAYSVDNILLVGYKALHCKGYGSLSDFWRIYESIKINRSWR